MLKQILSYIMITERVTGEVRLSLCSVVSISLRCCFLKDPDGTAQANPARADSLLILLLTGFIKLEPGSPNYGLRAFCAGGPVCHRTPLPSAAGPLSSAHSASQNFSPASAHVFPGAEFSSASCPVPRGPEDDIPAPIMCLEMFIPLH